MTKIFIFLFLGYLFALSPREGAFPCLAPTTAPDAYHSCHDLSCEGPWSPCFAALAYPALLAMQSAHLPRITLCFVCYLSSAAVIATWVGVWWIINCMINNEIRRDPPRHGSALICREWHMRSHRDPRHLTGGFMRIHSGT